ncbi:MAG: proton-conducting transporter membrane subunit [Candidatus Coatesbacteria bacterium]|mgnify:CR=1 FL=1
MPLLLIALAILVSTGLAALAAGGRRAWAVRLGAGGAVAACLVGLVPAIRAVAGAPDEALDVAWSLPGGACSLGLDPLSGFFLAAILALGALAAVYGAEYLAPTPERPRVGAAWWWYNLLIASMAVVVCARNAVLFLIAWEIMTLASFFLVVWEDHREDARRAGWTYLVAAHIGTACLIGFFVGLGDTGGPLGLGAGHAPSLGAGWLFLLALLGFGVKAGFIPLHVWLPEAHPAAPSHVSAVMSGVMIKIGIYGLLRALTLLGPAPASWGWVLLAVGIVSGILGVLNALAQHDLKRLLAYHSVENIGIIAMGIGLGVIAQAAGCPAAAVLGYAGGLLHVANHATFKGLLFLDTGSVVHATGTRHLEDLGGLAKRMPRTAFTFLVGAVAISGLPPLNGFVSEFLILLAAFSLLTGGAGWTVVAAVAAIASLAMIGTLATACFTKAFGVVFLGEPRSDHARRGHDPAPAMQLPSMVLAALCVAGGLGAPWVVGWLAAPVGVLAAGAGLPVGAVLADTAGLLAVVAGAGAAFLALAGAAAYARRRLLTGRSVTGDATWGCGYAAPTARMQYTASSFAAPLVKYFNSVLGTRKAHGAVTGYFPRHGSFSTGAPDLFATRLLAPTFRGVSGLLGRLRGMQAGRVQLYVAYVAAMLVALLLWEGRR